MTSDVADRIIIGNTSHTSLYCKAAALKNSSGRSGLSIDNFTGEISTQSSSIRYKKDVVEVTDEEVDSFDKLQPVSFRYKTDESQELNFGFLA